MGGNFFRYRMLRVLYFLFQLFRKSNRCRAGKAVWHLNTAEEKPSICRRTSAHAFPWILYSTNTRLCWRIYLFGSEIDWMCKICRKVIHSPCTILWGIGRNSNKNLECWFERSVGDGLFFSWNCKCFRFHCNTWQNGMEVSRWWGLFSLPMYDDLVMKNIFCVCDTQ